jgi:hypothetical protein
MKDLNTQIWWRNHFVKVNPDKAPADERQLISFLRYNNAPACFVKTGNAWRKLTKEGQLVEVTRALYLLSFKDWLRIALDDNFIA